MSNPTPIQVSSHDTASEETTHETAAGTKRSLPDDESLSEDEVKRLRNKNRTNSKRFRDRKKSYMDGLFEEKYRLGKSNNDLRDDNEKLRLLLEEAMLENQHHKRNSALGLYTKQNTRIPPPPANSSALFGMPLMPVAGRPSSLADVARIQHNARIENELLALRKSPLASTPTTSWSTMTNSRVFDLLGEVEARKREQVRQELALRDLEASMTANMMTNRHPSVGRSSYYRGPLRFI